MSSALVFLSVDEALYIHAIVIERFGGAPGVRDMGLLDSALSRPQTGYYETLAQHAAALMQSLATNHPFIDGNKRVAIALTFVFIQLNGMHVKVSADEAERFLIERIISGSASVEEITEWIERHTAAGPG